VRIPGVQKRWNKLKYMKKLKQLTPPSLAKKRGIKGDLTMKDSKNKLTVKWIQEKKEG